MQCRRSVRLCLLAAAQGDAEAQASLGFMFWRGEGIAKDQAEAVRFLRLAAAQGHARAQCSLGIWLSVCPSLGRDPAEADSWMLKAASNGVARAQVYLGYVAERGVPQDRAEAIRWFSLAAAQGCTEGADGLRRCRV